MVYEKMAIVAEPRKVIRFVVLSIAILVMHREHTFVFSVTHLAHPRSVGSFENSCICRTRTTVLPAFVFWAEENLISPDRLTRFVAKIILCFCHLQQSRFSIQFFSTGTARDVLPRAFINVMALGRTIFALSAQ